MENKWMTREEFEKLNIDHCWIACDIEKKVLEVYFYNGRYYTVNDSDFIHTDHIKAVMPIEKPEYPSNKDVITDFVNNQESLGSEFEKVLYDSLDDLYQP
jgi:hypothetical protein